MRVLNSGIPLLNSPSLTINNRPSTDMPPGLHIDEPLEHEFGGDSMIVAYAQARSVSVESGNMDIT